jgi:replication initiation and membrane attachment protein DnaB
MSSEHKKQKLMKALEELSVEDFLSEVFGEENPSPFDLVMVTKIQDIYQLPTPVMNVAIYYTLLREEMNLVKYTLNELAKLLSGNDLKTVKESLQFLKWSHQTGLMNDL